MLQRSGYAMGDKQPDSVLAIIGEKGHLSQQDAEVGAALWKQIRRDAPGAHFIFTIHGYDEDPRALWEIPEAAEYIRTWAKLVGLDDLEEAERAFGSRYDPQTGDTLGLLDLCLVFDDKPLFTSAEQLQ
jgi:hypothetical protein